MQILVFPRRGTLKGRVSLGLANSVGRAKPGILRGLSSFGKRIEDVGTG